jgi:hypothetical protein
MNRPRMPKNAPLDTIMIDGLGAQKVIRDAPTDEIKHIARTYVAIELGMADSTP